MKHVLLFPLMILGLFQVNSPFAHVQKSTVPAYSLSFAGNNFKGLNIGSQAEPGTSKMSAAEFRAQQYCHTELKDFDFDAHFSVVSATIYFSGTNFRNIEKGTITSESFRPIRSLVDRCAPGSIVVFDEVKVIGPDKLVRIIPGLTIMLH